MTQNPITLEGLTVLDAIDRRGSYAAAAEQLNKVPSALSYIVNKLEQQLSVTLFQRQGRRSVLTPAGKHLLAEGRHILTAVSSLADKTRSIANGWESKLRIAIDSAADIDNIFVHLNTFLQEYPFMEVDISEEVMGGSWESLIDDRVDLLLGAPAPMPRQKGLRAIPYAEFDPVFVVSPQHPLAAITSPLSTQQVEQHRTVVVHDSSRTAIARTTGVIEQSRHLYVPTIEYKALAIIAGAGCGYLPRSRVQHQLDSGALVELCLEEGRSPEKLYIAWKLANRGKGLKALVAAICPA
jgi:DNA-binding transcriptional LysR family regulator